METESANQTIEQLQERYRDLHTKKIQADTNLDNAKAKLDELKQEALEKFGTDNVDELREKLRAMKAENEEKRKKYQAELDDIEANLANVERKFSSAESPQSDSGEET
jgi:chromosome segregation ATPase